MNGTKFVDVTIAIIFWAALASPGRSQSLAATTGPDANGSSRNGTLPKIQHIVVIYQENHSFDNLYGGWEGVNGRANADSAHTIQVGQAGTPYACLLQNDFSLTSPPLPADCLDATTATMFASHLTNTPFRLTPTFPRLHRLVQSRRLAQTRYHRVPTTCRGVARATSYTAFIRNSISSTAGSRTVT